LLAAGEPVKARLEFQNALQLDERLAPAWYGLARVAQGQARWDEAYGLLGRVRDIDPGHLAAQVDQARILLAAGPDTPEVLGKLTGYDGFATRFPVNKVPGFLVSTPEVEEGLVRHLVYTDSGGEFHVFPEQGGGLRLASDDTDGQMLEDGSPGHLRFLARGLLQRMQDTLPGFVGPDCLDDCALSVGVRAYPEDGKSIAGALPGAEGVFVIATHSGITVAPALGSLMAELIAEGSVPTILAPFGLERLPGF
jgi:glycine/D-amino acid oxidase-like deaminating enzyme